MEKICEGIWKHKDTSNVFILENEKDLVIIYPGDGSVLTEIKRKFPNKKILGVLTTHHFRPQNQGLNLYQEKNIPIYVPYWEQDLFAGIENFWREKQTWISYDGKWDRYSIIKSIKPSGYLMDYDKFELGGFVFEIVPTPGPSIGAISIITNINGKRVCFSGDIIYSAGKIYNIAVSQLNYNDAFGLHSWIDSIEEIKKERPDIILPANGCILDNSESALNKLSDNIIEFLIYKGDFKKGFSRQQMIERDPQGLEKITKHLYYDKDSGARTFFLISESGKVLALDYGYNSSKIARPNKCSFASRRIFPHGIEALKKQFGIDKIDIVIPTHIHDDHVGGIPLLQRLYNTKLWVSDKFADVLSRPYRWNSQCLWPEAAEVHKSLKFGEKFRWEEYTFRIYPAGAHTIYSNLIEFTVDGVKVVNSGDQQGYDGKSYFMHNYVYLNRYSRYEMERGAKLLRKLNPDILISGHWETVKTSEKLWDLFIKKGKNQRKYHELLLPKKEFDLDDSILGEVYPYRIEINSAVVFPVTALIRNPFNKKQICKASLVLPKEWKSKPDVAETKIDALGESYVFFTVIPSSNTQCTKQPIAVDVYIGKVHLGQIAEAIVTINPKEKTLWGGGVWADMFDMTK